MNLAGLENKRVLITAGASGIGRVMAEGFLAQGACVHVLDIDQVALDRLGTELPSITQAQADVADPDAVDAAFASVINTWGGIDVLVNNAGIAGPTGPIESISAEDWARTVAVDLNGMFHCLRRAVPHMKAQRSGSIVNMSSTAGTMGYPLRTPYAAAKWGVVGLSKSLAMELGEFGINVNAVCPGSVEGDRMDRVIAAEAKVRNVSEDSVRKSYTRHVSMRTFVKPNDIADLVLFLCSDHGARISGQALTVDGHSETLSS